LVGIVSHYTVGKVLRSQILDSEDGLTQMFDIMQDSYFLSKKRAKHLHDMDNHYSVVSVSPAAFTDGYSLLRAARPRWSTSPALAQRNFSPWPLR